MNLRIAFVSIFFLTSYYSATACEFRTDNRVSVSHQRSAEVISALREATVAGVLPKNSAGPKNSEHPDNGSTMERMQRFGNALASSGAKAAAGLSILLVEHGLWSRYRVMQEGVAFQIQTRGAQADDTIVITGDAVLAAMERGTLSSDEAVARGLIVIVPGDSIDDGKILSAFTSFVKADKFGQPIAFQKLKLRWPD